MKTIFIDIDGTLIYHNGDISKQIKNEGIVLAGVLEKFIEWNRKGYCVVLTTGRKECMRELTKNQLLEAGIFYDQLVMGLPRGPRVLINDDKPGEETITATSIMVERNKGIEDIYV